MSAPKKKLTRKRLNNALVKVYKNHPSYFTSAPKPLSFFDHVYQGHLDDVQEYFEDPEFNINMRLGNDIGCLFVAIDGLGGLPMVQLLVEHGADINMMNFAGEVPIHILLEDLLSITKEKLNILSYFLDQEKLLLIPFHGKPIEDIILRRILRIDTIHQNYLERTYNRNEISQNDEDYHAEQMDILDILSRFHEQIEELSADNLQYIKITSINTKEKEKEQEQEFRFVDTRMSVGQFRLFVLRQVIGNPTIKLDFFFQGRLLDPTKTLAQQGIGGGSTILYQVRLSTGFISRGGYSNRKTRRSHT